MNPKPFRLQSEPMDMQLTVHYQNYNQYFGKGRFERDIYTSTSAHINNLIRYYGFTKILSFLQDVVQVGKKAS